MSIDRLIQEVKNPGPQVVVRRYPPASTSHFTGRRAAAGGHTLTPLEAEMARESVARPQARIKCKKCGEIFLAVSGRQKLCEECGKQTRKERQRECTRQRRQKRSSELSVAI